jgi:hypothetical protein
LQPSTPPAPTSIGHTGGGIERSNTMSSPARNFANAANAQLSTGPRTEAGKTQSAQNARKHGLTAVELLIPFGDREEFEALHADCETDIRPQGALQQSLFDELVASTTAESSAGFFDNG